MRREDFLASDGKVLKLAVWDEVINPKAVVQIAHGMAEHIARYDEFARYLNENGFIVVGDDHRAHGLTDPEELGKSGSYDLFERTVEDEREITDHFKREKNLPVILFGHSYGSFITQRYLQKGDNGLKAAVVCGSAYMKGVAVALGNAVAKMKYKRHRDEEGKFFASVTFASYDKKLKEGKSAWLNRDKTEVEKYRADEFCGYTCSIGFYRWFFAGLKKIAAQKTLPLDASFPLMIISGRQDAVGGNGKLVKALDKRYRSFGLNPTLKLYDGARHEILNELNKAEVYADILKFLNDSLA